MPSLVEYDVPYYSRREKSFAFQAEVRTILDLIQPEKHDYILEVGCGSGFNLRALSRYDCDMVAGVDWLPAATKLSSDLSKGYSTIAGDARGLPLGDGTFTKIIAQHVIEHFEDPVSVLGEWRRVLKPGGLVLLTTPNQRFPEQDWFYDPSHHHIYTGEELARLVVASGFKVVDQRIINPFFISTKFHSFAARYLQWFYRFPFLSRRGMSLVLLAVKAGE